MYASLEVISSQCIPCLNLFLSVVQDILVIQCVSMLRSGGAKRQGAYCLAATNCRRSPFSPLSLSLCLPPPQLSSFFSTLKQLTHRQGNGKTDGTGNNPKKAKGRFLSVFAYWKLYIEDPSATSKISVAKVTQTNGKLSWKPCSVLLYRKLIISIIMPVIIFLIWLLFDCSFGISEQMLKLYSWKHFNCPLQLASEMNNSSPGHNFFLKKGHNIIKWARSFGPKLAPHFPFPIRFCEKRVKKGN